MRVAELQGALLDYWVGKAEGKAEMSIHPYKGSTAAFSFLLLPYRPSTDWAIGGPIIEKTAIGWNSKNSFSAYSGSHKGLSSVDGQPWEAWFCDDGPDGGSVIHEQVKVGKTMLEACMRAYVASKFGEEVPDTPPA